MAGGGRPESRILRSSFAPTRVSLYPEVDVRAYLIAVVLLLCFALVFGLNLSPAEYVLVGMNIAVTLFLLRLFRLICCIKDSKRRIFIIDNNQKSIL